MSGTGTGGDRRKIHDALAALIKDAGGPEKLIHPRGYSHMGLVVLDAVYSLRANYDTTVVPLLKKFCGHIGFDWAARNSDDVVEFDALWLGKVLKNSSKAELEHNLNRQLAPGSKKAKFVLSKEICDVLARQSAAKVSDFRRALNADRLIESELRSIQGVGPALMRYMKSLSGLPVVKPDTMVMVWIERAVGHELQPEVAATLFEAAVTELGLVSAGVDARVADHLVWRFESGRKISVN